MAFSLESFKSWSGALSAFLTAGFGLYVTVQNHAIDARLKDLEAAEKRAEIAANFSERLGKEGGILADPENPEKELLAISAMYALVADDANPIFRNIIRRTVYKLGSTLGKVHLVELEADTCKSNALRCKEEIDLGDALTALNELDAEAKQRPLGTAGLLTDQAVASPDRDKELPRLQGKVIRSIETIRLQQGVAAADSGPRSSVKGVMHLANLQATPKVCTAVDYVLRPEGVNPLAKSYQFASPEQERQFLSMARYYKGKGKDTASFVIKVPRQINVRREFPKPTYDPKVLPDIVSVIGPGEIRIDNPSIRVSTNQYCSLWARVRPV